MHHVPSSSCKKKQRWFCILIWQVTECILCLISLHLDLQDKYGQHWRQNSDKSIKKCPLFFLWRHFLFSGRLLFWTNSAGRVERSKTDGSDRTAIVESIDGPTGVTLQLQEKQGPPTFRSKLRKQFSHNRIGPSCNSESYKGNVVTSRPCGSVVRATA